MKILLLGIILLTGTGCSPYTGFNDPNIVWGTTAPLKYWTLETENQNVLDNMCLGNIS